ncbi:MAG: dihydropteroate synthase [Rhodospirillaceae bacterium]
MNQPRAYVTPRGWLRGDAAAQATSADLAWPLGDAARELAFTAVEINIAQASEPLLFSRTVYQNDPGLPNDVRRIVDDRIAAIARSPREFAGIDLTHPALMGVVNVTPDSFSDGGKFETVEQAVVHGLALHDAGAAIVDVGGESTRPGAAPVDPKDEIARVVPVVKGLSSQGVCVSIDSRHAAVMAAAIDAGAQIVNDVTALTGNAESIRVVVHAKVPVILMHMLGEPQTMQKDPRYDWAPGDVYDFLERRLSDCLNAGLEPRNVAIDPGIGFGKTVRHNAEVMNHLGMLHGLGCAVVLGASRKSFIARMSKGEGPDHRLPGSIAAALHGAAQGVRILRVHDVAETRQALTVVRHCMQSSP